MKTLDIIRTALLGALALLVLIGVIGMFSINKRLTKIESSTIRIAQATYLISEAPIMDLELIKPNIIGAETWSLPVGAWRWNGK
ncbi:hypothetical protein CEE36_08720 [candidate division TA06 bacterium B3_TA06]|uniref:Uncharacterized protein n=1 Tax=candidate division TA06 bacterium B3_TA06 TaxID=2012487 RepID=A0A532V1B1_UNCT6|nr:MAG: hypothetical protein CEE36_08720 [candidate division TA06 bacterium B3_TA06]